MNRIVRAAGELLGLFVLGSCLGLVIGLLVRGLR